MHKELTNCTYFDGESWISNQDIALRGACIADISPSSAADQPQHRVVPGFIDLQIYGAGGVLFSAAPSVDALIHMEDQLLKEGTTGFLACIATNTPDVFQACIRAAKAHREVARNCLGLHLEGPFLHPKRRGAHVEQFIRKATLDEVKALLEFGDGVIRMMTIAAEQQDDAVIQYLLDQGVILSLGHSDATFSQATKAYDQGIQSTTHLFNAMSPLHHRDPGIPTALFNHPKAQASIIADGLHVDFEVVKLSQRLLKERLFLITDAVTACSEGPYQHRLTGDKFVMPDGTLSGSALTMLQAVKNCVTHCAIDLEEALNMATRYPAKLIGADQLRGSISKGLQADLLVVDDNLDLKAVIHRGESIPV